MRLSDAFNIVTLFLLGVVLIPVLALILAIVPPAVMYWTLLIIWTVATFVVLWMYAQEKYNNERQ